MRHNNWFSSLMDNYHELVFAGTCLVLFILYYGAQKTLWRGATALLLVSFAAAVFWITRCIKRKSRAFSLRYWQLMLIAFISSVCITTLVYTLLANDQPFSLKMAGALGIFLNTTMSFVVYGILTLAGYVIGHTVLLRAPLIKKLSKPLIFFLSLVTGLYLSILFFYGASLIHELRVAFILWCLALLIIAVFSRRAALAFLRKKITLSFSLPIATPNEVVSWLLLLLVTLGVPFLLMHFTTLPHNGDDWRTYLNVPLVFIQNNGIALYPFDPLNQAPFAGTYFLIPLLMLFPGAAALMNSYFYVLMLIALVFYLRSFLSPRATWYATFITATLSIQLFYLASFRPDNLMQLLLIVILMLFREREDGGFMQYAYAGAALGFMVALKYNAVFAVITISTLLLFDKKPFKQKPLAFAALAIGAILAFAPWGLHNLVRFGSPLYPYTNGNHYHYLMRDSQTETQLRQFMDEDEMRSFNYNSTSNFASKILTTGFIVGIWPINNFGPLLILAAVAAALFFRKWNDPVRFVFIPLAATFAAWHFSSINQIHYISFVFPLLALVCARYLGDFKLKAVPLSMVLLLTGIFVSDARLIEKSSALYYHSYFLANDSRLAQYIKDHSRYFVRSRLLQELEQLAPRYVLLLFSDVNITVLKNNNLHIYNNYAQTVWADAVLRSPTDTDLARELHQRGITHIFIARNESFQDRKPVTDNFPLSRYLENRRYEFFSRLPVELEDDTGTVYRIPEPS